MKLLLTIVVLLQIKEIKISKISENFISILQTVKSLLLSCDHLISTHHHLTKSFARYLTGYPVNLNMRYHHHAAAFSRSTRSSTSAN